MIKITRLRRTQNFSEVVLGESIIYHEGNLAYDRGRRQKLGSRIITQPSGKKIKVHAPLTDEARSLDQMATSLYKRSTADFDASGAKTTGEFSLSQERHGVNCLYIAKRIKGGIRYA